MKGYTHFLSKKGQDKINNGVSLVWNDEVIKEVAYNNNQGSNLTRYRIQKKTLPDRVELKIFNGIDFIIGRDSTKKPKVSTASELEKNIFDAKNDLKSKQRFMDLVEANVKGRCYFWTYTFSDDVKELKEANYQFMKFIQRLKYNLKASPKYIAVPELQKKNNRNVWHYHVIFFDLGYYDFEKMESVWGNGFVYVKPIKDNNGWRIAQYMAKYLTKSDDVLKGSKKYFGSKNLDKPIIEWVNLDKDVMDLMDNHETIERTHISDVYGIIRYYSINLKKPLTH